MVCLDKPTYSVKPWLPSATQCLASSTAPGRGHQLWAPFSRRLSNKGTAHICTGNNTGCRRTLWYPIPAPSLLYQPGEIPLILERLLSPFVTWGWLERIWLCENKNTLSRHATLLLCGPSRSFWPVDSHWKAFKLFLALCPSPPSPSLQSLKN